MSNKVKKDYLPLGIAILMLILLIGALTYTILYKPNKPINKNEQNTLSAEDVLVNNPTTTCGQYDIPKLTEEAKNVKLVYEVLDDFNTGPAQSVDHDLNGDGVVDENDITNVYGYALRIKVTGLTDDMYLRVTNKTLNTINDYYKQDIDNKGYVFDEDYNLDLLYLDVKVLINNDECKSIVIREFETVLPRFNELRRAGLCTTDEYKDKDLCAPYIFDNDTYETQITKLEKEKEKVEKEKKEKEDKEAKDKSNKNITLIIVGVVAVIAVVATGVIVMKGSNKHEKK